MENFRQLWNFDGLQICYEEFCRIEVVISMIEAMKFWISVDPTKNFFKGGSRW